MLGFKVDYWTLVGLTAQGLFFLRFIVQWFQSEKNKKITVPIIFWYISLIGALLSIFYALARMDLVFFITGFLQIFLYIRNLAIAKNEKKY